MSNCPKCKGFVSKEYDDMRCVNCGWRKPQKLLRPITTIRTGEKSVQHFDPDIIHQRKQLAKFIIKCPGSSRLGYTLGAVSRCWSCNKVVGVTVTGKNKVHSPSAAFALGIKDVVAEYVYSGDFEDKPTRKEKSKNGSIRATPYRQQPDKKSKIDKK